MASCDDHGEVVSCAYHGEVVSCADHGEGAFCVDHDCACGAEDASHPFGPCTCDDALDVDQKSVYFATVHCLLCHSGSCLFLLSALIDLYFQLACC